MPLTEVVQAFVVSGLSRVFPALNDLIESSDHPFAERVRDVKPLVWATDEVIKDAEIQAKNKG